MGKLSRRKFLSAGIAATAGVSGVAVAANLAKRYGLLAPDHGGIYGPGEMLTYATQRLLTRHSLAREFPRSMISKVPFANAIAPLNDAFKRLQSAGFADWRLSIDWLGGATILLLPGRPKDVSGSQSDHRSRVRGRMVLHCRVDWNSVV